LVLHAYQSVKIQKWSMELKMVATVNKDGLEITEDVNQSVEIQK
jgi:hypothetical protein